MRQEKSDNAIWLYILVLGGGFFSYLLDVLKCFIFSATTIECMYISLTHRKMVLQFLILCQGHAFYKFKKSRNSIRADINCTCDSLQILYKIIFNFVWICSIIFIITMYEYCYTFSLCLLSRIYEHW